MVESGVYIVTGGAGFIGSNVAKMLEEQGKDVVVIDNFSSGHEENLKGFKGKILRQDIRYFYPNALKKPIAGVIHLAANTDTTIMDKRELLAVNTDASILLFEYCHSHNLPFVYASSGATYGHTPAPMVVGKGEEPANFYGLTKLHFDHYVRLHWKNDVNTHAVGLRYFNVYGPGESFKGKMASMIWQLSQQMKAGNRPKVFPKGEQERDFIYVEDVTRVTIDALKWTKGIYNIGTGESRSFIDIIENLNRVMGTKLEPEFIPNPYNFFQKHTLADLKSSKEQGFVVNFDLEKGIEAYMDWAGLKAPKTLN